MVRVLQLLTELLKLGCYSCFNDVKNWLPAIIILLDGKLDFPTIQVKEAIQHESKPKKSSFYRKCNHLNYISVDLSRAL